MSIASEITRLQNAKASIKTSIEAKGVTVPSSAKLDDYSDYVDAIQTGGGTSKIAGVLEGTVTTMNASDFDGATTLRGSAFRNCTSLTSVTLPNTLTSMSRDGYQFDNCTSLTSFNASSTLSELPNYCFNECSNLTNINLSNITTLNRGVFRNCTSLVTIDVSNVTSFGFPNLSSNPSVGTFSGCSSLSNITWSTSVDYFYGYNFFKDCSSLRSFVAPTYTGNVDVSFQYGFEGCTSLETLDLRGIGERLSGVSMGSSTATLPNLTTVQFPTTVKGNFYNGSGRMLQGTTSLTTITLPTPVSSTTQCGAAILQYSGITSITTPNNLKTLGNYMFDHCSSLASVTISADVNSINQYCFANCPLLTEITYLGTMAQWNSATKGSNWMQNTPLATVHCSDGDITL